MLDIQKIRNDFPILHKEVHGKPLVYLDNTATTQKPRQVIERMNAFYSETNSNIHRGVHHLSEQSSHEYEMAREKVRGFINAGDVSEIIFTKGTTESINLVAHSYGDMMLQAGDEVIVSEMEHHSNIVPWQLVCEKKQATLKVLPMDDDGRLRLEKLNELITAKTKLLAVTWVSNTLGCINPVKEIVKAAHERGVPVLLDAAQAVQHMPVDVQQLDCDFLAFSGHKMYAHAGIGVLYGKRHLLEEMPPYQGGGGMIDEVTFEKTTWARPPLKFEAGTTNYPGAVSLAAAIDYLLDAGIDDIMQHEKQVYDHARKEIAKIEGLKIYGNTDAMTGAISFNLDGVHHYDAGVVLDKLGIAVRTGHHCAQPLMRHYGVQGTIRASFGLYNTKQEVDRLIEGVNKVRQMF